ncbi:aminotransferase class V-fold PLP-dependent enzyme [Ureibacillus aquaedulcis]|uniref:Aminotransferase class V-fold PLP-dependent enzyme n=1 Tax=Ureibacillus aquaedulcis TaxID=3058421 RepID=A0ABT8GMF1_9BACL|nr:aminotransferase class V-fold PLP-dependent enzyme [Ureibacillus sp. BA0131]MDN4492607.1 aminotransferase class V-fold PLP-dependent enzyme [Ureibacillus sp. BA0131]
MNFSKERKYFPILEEKVQLSSCSQSALSIQVQQSLDEFMQTWISEGMDWNKWMVCVEETKALFAKMINASPEEIAILSSVSDAASTVASALNFDGQRNKIVTTELDFPSIGHVWLAQKKRGAKVDFIPAVDNKIALESYDGYVDHHTLVTSISHVSYYNGFKQDLKSIASKVHSKGSYLFVDAYQSAGSVEIDVKEMDIDFLSTGSQKFMLGTPGIAFLYVKSEIAEQLEPSTTGWFGRVSPFAFDIKQLDYAEGAKRFNTGTPPMINAYAARGGLTLLNEIGVDRIEKYLSSLSSFAINYAKEKDFKLASPEDLNDKASNTAIFIPNAAKMEQQLRQDNVIVSARNDVIRIAPHFYNTEEDIATAIDKMAYLLAKA